MHESDFMRKLLKLLEEKNSWGPRKDWTTYNYSRLSKAVKEASGTSLSTRTLRRLCNNYRNYKPQAATKDALSVYLGYKDWEEFKVKYREKGHVNGGRGRTTRPGFTETLSMIVRSVWLYVGLVVLAAIITVLAKYPDIRVKLDEARVEFTSNYELGTAPQRVTFYYDVSRINSTNIFINENFYDDGEIFPINKNRHYFTTDFDLPDHYSVKILANGERISCIRIHVITNGWEGIVNGQHTGRLTDPSLDGVLAFNSDSVDKYMLAPEENLIEFRNIREFGLIGDDMTLETELRVLPDDRFPESLETTVQVINLHGRVGFDFVQPGFPESMLSAEFGDVLLNGEFQDLDAFYQDFTEWRKVTITVRDQHIYVLLEGEEIYSVKYTDPLDEVKGIAYKFRGWGEVNYVKLYDGEGVLVYEDTF